MRGRTLIISDTHFAGGLGTPRPNALRPLWQGFDNLIVNGDVAEIHHPRQRAKAARAVLELQRMCRHDEVSLSLISGNHDAYISDLRHLQLHYDRILVTHGDALHPAIAPWSAAAPRIREATAEALDRLDDHELSLAERLEIFQHASRAEWDAGGPSIGIESAVEMIRRPVRIARMLRYWHTLPELARNFARAHAPQARYLVVGHAHRPGIWSADGLTVINTGNFGVFGRPLAVIVDDASISVWTVTKHHGAYRRADQPLLLEALPPSCTRSEADARNTLPAGLTPAAAMM